MSETSVTQQLMMNNLSMTSQIMQGTFSASSNINGAKDKNSINNTSNLTVTNNLGKLAYAVEGDLKYKEEIDSNGDGVISYDEYVKYITDSLASKYNIPKNGTTFSLGEDSQTGLFKFSVTNMTKILTAYLNSSVQLPSGLIEKDA